METKDVYLCKDCKHRKMDLFAWVFTLGGNVNLQDWMYTCRKSVRLEKRVINPVTGPEKIKKKLEFCSTARISNEFCGPDARHWSPKHKKDLFKAIKRVYNE